MERSHYGSSSEQSFRGTYSEADEDWPDLSPSASTYSYPSTTSSHEDIPADASNYAAASDERRMFWNDAVATTPSEFAKLFPSSRELLIRHDDTTLDGNMNLRVDTIADVANGGQLRFTLFHLRMIDLRSRTFSLRRYTRDSGREICHCSRKAPEVTVSKKPSLQRSLSGAISRARSKSELKGSGSASLKRQDSGYESMNGDFEQDKTSTLSEPTGSEHYKLQDDVSVDFSNYAHLKLRRHGLGAGKTYDFEYWGERYAWRRVTKQLVNEELQTSFELVRRSDEKIVASIVPTLLSVQELEEERDCGGWVSPMTFRLCDERIIEGTGDISDTVVATGLIVLCDDSIRQRFHQKEVKQLVVPLPLRAPLKIDMELVNPKRILEEAFSHR